MPQVRGALKGNIGAEPSMNFDNAGSDPRAPQKNWLCHPGDLEKGANRQEQRLRP